MNSGARLITAVDGKRMLALWLTEDVLDLKLPEVDRLKGVPQPAEYHEEGDAFVHTLLAVEAVPDDADIRVFWGTLLHDIGKSVTTSFINGGWHSYGHAEAGARMTPVVMERLGLSDLIDDVKWLVTNHLFHFSWQLPPNGTFTRNQLRLLEHPIFSLLLQVCTADAAASIGRSKKGEALRRITEFYDSLKDKRAWNDNRR